MKDHLYALYVTRTLQERQSCSFWRDGGSSRNCSDLLKRHVTRHDTPVPPSSKRQKVAPAARPRTSQACVTCAEAKLRCEGPAPCRGCVKKGVPCTYPESRQKRGMSMPNRTEAVADASNFEELDLRRQHGSFGGVDNSQAVFSEAAAEVVPTSNTRLASTGEDAEMRAGSAFDTCKVSRALFVNDAELESKPWTSHHQHKPYLVMSWVWLITTRTTSHISSEKS